MTERPRRLPARFHPAAEADFLLATAWYCDRSAQVAERFVDEIETVLDSIRMFPDAGSLVLEDVRQRMVRPFPYRILYRARADLIEILAVAHTSRHPDFWTRRLGREDE